MRPKTWLNRNKMAIETGLKAFDDQAVCISPGQSIGPGQVSMVIRPADEVSNGFETRPRGFLRDHDLAPFRSLGMPRHVETAVLAMTETEKVTLYCFSHVVGGRRIVHGFVAARSGTDEILDSWVTGPTRKSADVVRVCSEYVTYPKGTMERVRASAARVAAEADPEADAALASIVRAATAVADEVAPAIAPDVTRRVLLAEFAAGDLLPDVRSFCSIKGVHRFAEMLSDLPEDEITSARARLVAMTDETLSSALGAGAARAPSATSVAANALSEGILAAAPEPAPAMGM